MTGSAGVAARAEAVDSIFRFAYSEGWSDSLAWALSHLDLSEEDRDRVADRLATVEEHS